MTPSAVAAPSGVAHVTPAAILPAAHDHPTIGFPLSLEPLTRIRWVIHRLNTCTGLPRYRDRVTTPATPRPRQKHPYLTAGRNHVRAAEALHAAITQNQRTHLVGPADHLAGVGAECAVKAILIDFLGSRYNGLKGKPSHTQTGDHGHLSSLWPQFEVLAKSRNAVALLKSITRSKHALQDWNLHERYDGTCIPPAVLGRHIKAANHILAAHQHARVTGSGTGR